MKKLITIKSKNVFSLSPLPSPFSPPKGYTYIELLLVLSLIGFVMTIGIASFVTYNDSQVFQTGVTSVADMYDTARVRSVTQIKPSQCANSTLNGYQVVLKQNQTYELQVVCNDITYTIKTQSLPGKMTFANTSPATIFFAVSTAVVTIPGVVTINGYGKSQGITIEGSGNISVK